MVGFLKWAGGLTLAMVALTLVALALASSPWWLAAPVGGWFVWTAGGLSDVWARHQRRFPS